MKKNRSTDTSHLIPRSRADEGFNVNADVNKEQWYYQKHHSYHSVFSNDLPHEAIERILEMFQAVLRPEFIERVKNALEGSNEEIYVDEVLKIKNETREKVMNIIDESEFGELEDKEVENIKNFYRNNAPRDPEEEYKKKIDECIEKGEIPVYEENEIRNDTNISMRDAQYLLDYIKKKCSTMLLEEFGYFKKQQWK